MTEIYIASVLIWVVMAIAVLRLGFWMFGNGTSFGDWARHGLLRRPRNATHDVQKSALAHAGVGNLPLDVAVIAGLGKGGEAPQTIGDHFLRPTIGLRLISLGLSALCLYFILFGPEEYRLPFPVMTWSLTAALIYGVLYIQTYEARYDDYRIVYRGWLFQRKEALWSEVYSINDDGQYQYILRTDSGKRVEIQKNLVGIVDFVSYANQRIAENRRKHD